MKRIGLIFKTKKIFFVLVFIPILFFISSIVFSEKPVLYKKEDFSWVIRDKKEELLWLSLSADEKYCFFVPYNEISKEFINATLLYEDRDFYSHFGVNFFSLARAMYSMAKGERRLGASTITMQLVRLVENKDTSSIIGKLYQIWRAFIYEYHYSKEEILEAYLNLAPYGANVEGIGAASYVWFHKRPHTLNVVESVALATIPQNPVARSPLKKNNKEWEKARKRLQKVWNEKYPHALNALYENVILKIYTPKDLPLEIPHAVMEIYQDREKYYTKIEKKYSLKNEIITTFDLTIQKNLESVFSHYLAEKKIYGIENASMILANWQTGEIVSLIGSGDFHNKKISGQIDGTNVRRSPGSTLKPFIYALSLEQGLIHSKSILLDTKKSFAGYEPENSDGDFQGPIAADKALHYSRNIPAIYLANNLHSPDLYDFLKKAHVNFMFSKKHYGLALVLGGAEITLRELANLYATLPNNGIFRELSYYKEEKTQIKKIISAEASYITLKMMETKSLFPFSSVISSWKTGTSNGLRDALSAGIIGPYVLIVWIGNFDSSPNPNFTGTRVALPLYFLLAEKLQELEGGLDKQVYSDKGLNVKKISVCQATGDIDTKLCPNMVHDIAYFIPGVSPIKNTGILREILVNTQTGLRECKEIEGITEKQIFEFWPIELQKLFDKAGVYKKKIPPYALHCLDENVALLGKAPQIKSPVMGISYQQDKNNTQEIALIADLDADTYKVHWFIDTTYLGSSVKNVPFYIKPHAGKHIIYAVDDFGRSARVTLKVEKVNF